MAHSLQARHLRKGNPMKLEITEEDHQFIESIVEGFDPAKRIERPEGVSDADWSSHLEFFRIDLRHQLKAALICRALREAGLIPTDALVDVEAIADLIRPEYTSDPAGVESEHSEFMNETESAIKAVAVGAEV